MNESLGGDFSTFVYNRDFFFALFYICLIAKVETFLLLKCNRDTKSMCANIYIQYFERAHEQRLSFDLLIVSQKTNIMFT